MKEFSQRAKELADETATKVQADSKARDKANEHLKARSQSLQKHIGPVEFSESFHFDSWMIERDGRTLTVTAHELSLGLWKYNVEMAGKSGGLITNLKHSIKNPLDEDGMMDAVLQWLR